MSRDRKIESSLAELLKANIRHQQVLEFLFEQMNRPPLPGITTALTIEEARQILKASAEDVTKAADTYLGKNNGN